MSEYELLQLLEECGYEPSDENLEILKEGLANGELAIVEEEVLTEGKDIADEKTEAQVVLRGNENRFVRRYIKRTYKRKLKALKKKEKAEKKRLKAKTEEKPEENSEETVKTESLVLYVPENINLDEGLTEYQLMQILDENNCTTNDEDVDLLIEAIETGKVLLETRVTE